MLKRDINRLQSLKVRRTVVPAKSVEDAYHLVYSCTQPWLGLARAQRTASDSSADQVRWDVWIAALTPSPHGIRGTWAQVCLLAGQGRDMLRALSEALVPCLSVGSVSQEVQQRIMSGTLSPSSRIRERKLARSLQVPASYVRLALADLATTGLVEVRANGYFAVVAVRAHVSQRGQQQQITIRATETRAA
ncbi:GntR family transcriptional regulator [Streptomyces microflavus]|uniref:GntR family transcriptional regulator n=1 Tax=Streptomyces microflavus TaxID=1919 RepID=UPI002E34AF1A|nr:GntR family transcriptional regulator [Streptomyces microflavus]